MVYIDQYLRPRPDGRGCAFRGSIALGKWCGEVSAELTLTFQALNEEGREEAIKRVQELTELKRYRK